MRDFYHVTERADAESILADGFEGGWGDVGFGVYMYGNPYEAQLYAGRGGWDGRLVDPVIIVVSSDAPQQVMPDLGWPNPEDYADVHWHELDENADETWKPLMALLHEKVTPSAPCMG